MNNESKPKLSNDEFIKLNQTVDNAFNNSSNKQTDDQTINNIKNSNSAIVGNQSPNYSTPTGAVTHEHNFGPNIEKEES